MSHGVSFVQSKHDRRFVGAWGPLHLFISCQLEIESVHPSKLGRHLGRHQDSDPVIYELELEGTRQIENFELD